MSGVSRAPSTSIEKTRLRGHSERGSGRGGGGRRAPATVTGNAARLNATGITGKASRSPEARRRPRSRHLEKSLVGGTVERRSPLRTHLAVVVAILAACRGSEHVRPPGRVAALTVTDDAGRTVALARPARRVVSLSPTVTELLFALGAGDRLVGRTTWCDYPPAARAVPSVGDGLNPNIEAVSARRPDLVVLYRSTLNETAARQLERLGVAAGVLRQDRLDDVAPRGPLLRRLVGPAAAGDALPPVMDSVYRRRLP